MQKLLDMRYSGRGKRLALAVVSAVLVVGAIAPSALAAQTVELSPEGPYAATGSTAVTVTGSVPAGTELVGIAVCDAGTGVAPGTRCDINSASNGGELFPASEYTTEGFEINVSRVFEAADFTSGEPKEGSKEFVTCLNKASEGTQCAVEVSYYNFSAPNPSEIETSEVTDILFE